MKTVLLPANPRHCLVSSSVFLMFGMAFCRFCRPIMTKPKPAAPETPPPAPQGSEQQQGDASASATPNGKAGGETEVPSASTDQMETEKSEPTSAA